MVKTKFIYTDRLGSITGKMANDGEVIQVVLGKWEFVGTEFNDLEPITSDLLPERFKLHHNALCDCEFEFEIPILINDKAELLQAKLIIFAKLGIPDKIRGGIEDETYRMSLTYDGETLISSGKSGWFEDELLEIQAQIPKGSFMKACINCQYSDYSPYGHGAFGAMMCFKNIKSEYKKVQSKADFWEIHNRNDRFVQETFLCDEFERRIPGAGYRG